jgi:hypothetical protein
MDVPNIRRWRCVICQKNEIVEHQIEHTCPEGSVPDQSNCDLSTYDGYRVEGGRLLLKAKSIQPWKLEWLQTEEQEFVPPLGGICNGCLTLDATKKLIPYIQFV